MTDQLVWRLALSLAIGLLVGLERGWRERDQPDRSRTAGIRTYGISGLLGGINALLSSAMGAPSVLVAGILIFATILTLYKVREAMADGDYSVTAVIAGLTVFMLGALAVLGDYVLASAGGAALAAVLASREVLHAILKRMTWEELRAALILAVMTAIVLPLLPDHAIDPWHGVNPRQIWLFTILVAALSYAGYIATRLFGQSRGLVFSALFGAIVSSTAVTVALARRSREAHVAMAGAASLAAAISISRVCLIVVVTAPTIAAQVAASALSAAAVFAITGCLLVFHVEAVQQHELPVRNPFELVPLLGFSASFAIIAGLSAYLSSMIGSAGMLATSALSGIFDADVAVLSAVRQLPVGSSLTDVSDVANSVLLALVANAVGRSLLAAALGTWRFSALYAAASLLAVSAGAAIHAL